MKSKPHGQPTSLQFHVDRMVPGGLGLAHESDGRVVLIDGALPGDTVKVEVTESKARLLRARVTEVLLASPERIVERCPEVALGCGGCDLQHASLSTQQSLKVAMVSDALRRIGRVEGVPIRVGRQLPGWGYRTTLRCGVGEAAVGGQLGFRRRHSNQIHVVDTCLVAHPLVAEIVESGRFPSADEVTIRAGANTGERLVVVSPSAADAVVPEGVTVVGSDVLANCGEASYHEIVAGRRFRISANSFFQTRVDGAEALVDAVGRALAPILDGGGRLVDLYGGVGLFTGALGARDGVLVERSRSSAADARVNLKELGTEVIGLAVERWRPSPFDAVVVDPARSGLGKEAAAAVVATGAERVALVSCDPASLARDVGLLVAGGYHAMGVEIIDMFPQTHHIEAVTVLSRSK
ncbi:MAG: TRAM domain-containing protein [Microthrixaceae bacterium]